MTVIMGEISAVGVRNHATHFRTIIELPQSLERKMLNLNSSG